MQRNMYWYHYCNDLLEILDIHPYLQENVILKCFGAKSQENLIWCALNGLERAYIDFFTQ